MNRFLLHLLIWFTVPLLGCVYYNTFYNAQRSYRQAERIRGKAPVDSLPMAAVRLYDRAIEKAAKVVAFYPQSEWVDDALLLMGRAFYRKGEYQKAIRKFRELLANYPESDLRDEARLGLGNSYAAAEEYDMAEEVFRRIIREGNSRWAEESICRLAELLFSRGDYSGAQAECERLINAFSKGRYSLRARFLLGECAYQLGDYGQAQYRFQQVLDYNPYGDLRYETALRLGECLMAEGEYHRAVEVFQGLLADDHYYSRFPILKLKIAACKREDGDYEGAMAQYRSLAEEYPQTEFAAEALLNLGLIQQSRYFNLEKARESFEEVTKHRTSSAFTEEARANLEAIDRFNLYRSRLSWEKKGQDRTRFLLAELYLFRFSQVDSALAQYRFILDHFPESTYAPKAAYALAWTLSQVKGESGEARMAYQYLIENYPGSEYAAMARALLGEDGTVSEGDSPKARFLRAERQLLEGEDPDKILEGYQSVVETYPQSEYAPKAQYAIAWIWENLKQDHRMAHKAYDKLVSDYPNTPYAAMARKKLGLVGQGKKGGYPSSRRLRQEREEVSGDHNRSRAVGPGDL